jgi:hypothetical protein
MAETIVMNLKITPTGSSASRAGKKSQHLYLTG